MRPILGRAVGENYEEGVEAVFEALQNPVINKQVRSIKAYLFVSFFKKILFRF